MSFVSSDNHARHVGPFEPTLILHGGAGSISRSNLPPSLYAQYSTSLLDYLTQTHTLLTANKSPLSALDAACFAVSLMEDDPLFNCGRGAVFTTAGTNEMEASVAVSSVAGAGMAGKVKRSAAVSLVRNTRHPIMLAREVLSMADEDEGMGALSEMHGHLSGIDVEKWGWEEKGLEKKGREWFWTKRRWDEHRRGLGLETGSELVDLDGKNGDGGRNETDHKELVSNHCQGLPELPSQGTVGAVCLDSWGNVAVATSTGGLTNKRPGRIGDTPTVGAGFWAEDWEEQVAKPDHTTTATQYGFSESLWAQMRDAMKMQTRLWTTGLCASPWTRVHSGDLHHTNEQSSAFQMHKKDQSSKPSNSMYIPSRPALSHKPAPPKQRRAVAMSGTGNGDSFLRVNAVRTAAAMCRFASTAAEPVSLQTAVTAIAGPDGELQRSAGARWEKTGEGEGGIIGIEVVFDDDCRLNGVHIGYTDEKAASQKLKGHVVFDFNCGGMWRAYYQDGKPKVMVFKEGY